MSRSFTRRVGAAASVLAASFALVPAAQAAPAGEEPVNAELVSLEAALVRIDVVSDVTIAHINHSTGDVVIHRDTYPVTQGTATGVLLTGDGVVATLYRELQENLDKVTIPAANRLFVEQIGTQLMAGDGTTAATHATDPALDEHLQHCYQRVDHCIVVPHERYEVALLRAGQQDPLPATLLNEPTGPTDVALLRVGSGSLPTASLAPAREPVDEAAVAGLTRGEPEGDPPTAAWVPTLLPARLDGATLASDEDLPGALAGGLTGGPVVDRATGGVVALADLDPSTGTVSAVGADRIQAALDAAGIAAARSGFTIAFESGLALLDQERYAAAVRRLEAATTYFDSALARQHLQIARDRAGPEDAAAGEQASDDGGLAWWVWALLALLVLAGLTAALVVVRRRRPAGSGDRPAPTSAARHGPGGGEPRAEQSSAPAVGASSATGTASARAPADAAVAPTAAASRGPSSDAAPAPRADSRPEPARHPQTGGSRPSSGTQVAIPVPAQAAALAPQSGERSRPGVDTVRSSGPQSAGGSRAFCTKCGTALVPGDPYCGGCGSPVR